MGIYLDNSATTPISKIAKEKMLEAIDSCWGNPSSFHKKGIEALEILDCSRKIIAEKIGANEEEIFFTPGGTYSNNIAIFGAIEANKRKGNKIVTTCVEHPSVENVMKNLEEKGFEIVRLKVDKNCAVLKSDLLEAIDEKTILVSMMMVNNEVGSIMPVDFIQKAVKKKNSPALIHCDAVQGFGKIDIDVNSLKVDLMSVSSHKVNGPKGSGALYIRKGVKIKSPIFGGGQENDVAPGTQAMPAIAGFGGAVKDLPQSLNEKRKEIKKLKELLVSELEKIDGVCINSPENSLEYILNFSLKKIPSQPMITFLSQHGIYVSGGSACAKGHRSYVLSAMGIPVEIIDSAIRISMSRFTTEEEILEAVKVIAFAEKNIRKSR